MEYYVSFEYVHPVNEETGKTLTFPNYAKAKSFVTALTRRGYAEVEDDGESVSVYLLQNVRRLSYGPASPPI